MSDPKENCTRAPVGGFPQPVNPSFHEPTQHSGPESPRPTLAGFEELKRNIASILQRFEDALTPVNPKDSLPGWTRIGPVPPFDHMVDCSFSALTLAATDFNELVGRRPSHFLCSPVVARRIADAMCYGAVSPPKTVCGAIVDPCLIEGWMFVLRKDPS